MTPGAALAGAVRLYFRVALRAFFSRIEIEGAQHVPARGPVLLVPNHLNAFVDPLLVQLGMRRPLTLTAKRPLEERPLFRALMRLGRVITFYRSRDGARLAELRGLAIDLERCRSRLAQGEALCLFPEAKSHDDPRLRPFEQGAARIALEYVGRDGDPGGLLLVPVALHYEAKACFRSRAFLRFAEPLFVARWIAEHPGARHRELTAEVERRVRAMVEEHASRRDLILSRWTARAQIAAAARAETRPRLAEIVRASRALGGRWGRLRAAARAARSDFRRSGVEPEHVFLGSGRAAALRLALGSTAALLALLPGAAWGALHHALPFLLVRRATVRSATLPDLWASGAVYSSLLVFPPFYALEAVLAGLWLPLPWALLHLVTLPLCGWLALVFRDRWLRDAGRLRALALFRREPRLQQALGAELLGLHERLQALS